MNMSIIIHEQTRFVGQKKQQQTNDFFKLYSIFHFYLGLLRMPNMSYYHAADTGQLSMIYN